MGLGLLLAVIASVALNASYLMQHAGSSTAPAIDVRRPVRTLSRLLRSPWWGAGALLGIIGSIGHGAALYGAPLTLVQAFAVGGLVLTVPAAAWAFRQRLGTRDGWAVAGLIAALATLSIGAAPSRTGTIPTAALVVAVGAAAAVAALIMVPPRSRHRAVALGATGGILYGAGDAATKALAVVAHGGLLSALTSPWLAVYVVLGIGGFACFQRGLQLGPVVPVVVVMTAATGVVAILIGFLAFGEPLGVTPALVVAHLLAFGAAGVAGLRLVASESRLLPAA